MIGNGSMGAIVMGYPARECLMIGHEELFLPLFEKMPVLEMNKMLPELRKLIKEGQGREANRRVVEAAVAAGYPAELLMTNPFHPGFDLLVETGAKSEVHNYRRGVNFATGEAHIEFDHPESGLCRRRGFVSRADNVLVFELQAAKTPINGQIFLGTRPHTLEPWEAGRTSGGHIAKGSFPQRGIRAVETAGDQEFLTYRAAYAMTGGGYEGIARVHAPGGTIQPLGNGIRVRKAERLLIVATMGVLEDYGQSRLSEERKRLESFAGSYDELLEEHAARHGELFNRVRLTVPGGLANKEQAAEEQLANFRSGQGGCSWLQTVFDACRYNIISSSGILPPNLQGLWTGTWTPHWSGDYTLDANVQAAIAHYLSCGTPELMHGLFRLLDRMMPDFRTNARALYKARGLFVNSRVSTHGLQQRYNFCPVFFWTAGGAWLAHYYYDYYLYTGDRRFLRETALPFMREAALFFQDFLVKNEDGQYVFNPSWSPENRPAGTDSPVTINATMDIAAVRELLGNLIEACRELDIADPDLPSWQEILDNLPPYLTNPDGALKEWSAPGIEDNYSHRHMSHLYPLYPGAEADPEKNPELYRMCQNALRMRMRHYDPSDYSGFGLYHLATAAARANDPETALDALTHLLEEHIYTGMGTSHNPGPNVFNMDASGGIPAVVVEMLAVSRPGHLQLLPAAAGPLKRGVIEGVRCRGRIVLELLEWDLDKNYMRCRLRGQQDQTLAVAMPESLNNIKIKGASGKSAGHVKSNHLILELKKGQAVELTARQSGSE